MTDLPKVSVVVRTYNRPLKLQRAVKSISDQTYKNIEIIIVFDGGEKKTDHLSTSRNIKILEHEVNQGRAQAARTGLDGARGKYVLFHDDDDFLLPTAIEKMVLTVEKNQKAVGVICGYSVVSVTPSKNGGASKEKVVKTHIPTLPPKLIDMAWANELLTISTLVNRLKAIKAGGINTELEVLEDWDLWLRLLLIGDFEVCPEVLAQQYNQQDNANDASPQSSKAAHRLAQTQLQNYYLRQDVKQGRMGLGFLINSQNRELKEDVKFITNLLKKLKKTILFWT